MRKLISIILMSIGIFLPVYLLVSGIEQVVDAISPFIAKEVIFGILKIVFCEVGTIPFGVGYYVYTFDSFEKY